MECLVKNTNKSLISNRLPAGTIFYWAGKMNTKPEWALFCNGDSFPIPTSEEDEMWNLYQVIGTTYNKASGSGYKDATPAGHFSIPDFIRIVEDGGEKQVGLFIRSATNDDQVGVKQNDAIRNITGRLADTYPRTWNSTACAGPFFVDDNEFEGGTYSSLARDGQDKKTFFDLSRAIATAPENRPYTIYALPLISY